MELAQALAQERRARLTAERLLAQKQAELSVANRALSRHARLLSVEVIEQREEISGVRTDLARAETKAGIAERRLWTALTTISDGFAVFDADDRLVAANPAWLAPFDGVSAVAPGATYADILRIALEEGVVDIGLTSPADWLRQMLDRWTAERIEPMTVRLWNGRWVRLVDRRGDGGDMVSLALDITGAMRNERRLRAARGRAEAANRAKSAFLANMSHELRTPMNGVMATAELLGETALDPEQRGLVQTIRSSGGALLAIINDILDLSKIDAERMVLRPRPFDLERLAHEVLVLMRPLRRAGPARQMLRLVCDTDPALPPRVVGDPDRVRQILVNLVGNAVKFTDAGHVAVRLRPCAAGGGEGVEIVVEDTGIGILPDRLRHIFGAFQQVEDDHNRRFEGTGLGLSITDRLVRLMQGSIDVASEPGRGTGFTVRLPLPATAAPDLPAPLALRLVLAAPDPLTRAPLARLLRGMGATVAEAADPAAALAQAAGAAVVLVDPGLFPAAPDAGADAPPVPASAGALAAMLGPAVPVLLLGDTPDPSVEPGLAGVLPWPPSRAALHRALTALASGDVVDAPPPPDLSATPAPGAPPAAPRRMRVLAAEDNRTNQLVLGKMLKSLDIDLRFAANGVEAVAAHAGWAPDLIFMDISMPTMDGKEATRRIRAAEAGSARPPVTIVALTAHALTGDAEAILAAGLDHYLPKPLSKAALVEHLRAAWTPALAPLDPGPAPEDPAAPSAATGLFHSRRARLTAAE